MIINVEFFDEDPIENVITSLNYKVDKTLFLGYKIMIEKNRKCVERFLKKTCGVTSVEFCAVDNFDLNSIMDTILKEIEEDMKAGHKVFFDLTGGESLPLVAFGILSRELSAPMHMYDIRNGQIQEYGYEGSPVLSETAVHKPITLNLDDFISLYGGTINYRMHKDFKDAWTEEDAADVVSMWELSRKYKTKWVHYSSLLHKFVPDHNLTVYTGAKKVMDEIKKYPVIGTIRDFNQFLDDCEARGFFKNVNHEDGVYSFRYKNDTIKNYLWMEAAFWKCMLS